MTGLGRNQHKKNSRLPRKEVTEPVNQLSVDSLFRERKAECCVLVKTNTSEKNVSQAVLCYGVCITGLIGKRGCEITHDVGRAEHIAEAL